METHKLVKGTQAEYIPAEWDGTNHSGRIPFGKRVLIKCDECAPQSSGGIYLTTDAVERMTQAAESGVLVAIGADAFKRHDDGTLWKDEDSKPKLGVRVDFERYSGVLITGADGKFYRVMDYGCLAAFVAEGVTVGVIAETLDPEGES